MSPKSSEIARSNMEYKMQLDRDIEEKKRVREKEERIQRNLQPNNNQHRGERENNVSEQMYQMRRQLQQPNMFDANVPEKGGNRGRSTSPQMMRRNDAGNGEQSPSFLDQLGQHERNGLSSPRNR